MINKSGFKNINIQFYQRYNFSNHLGWFLKREPGGHNVYRKIISDELNQSYCENLKKLGQIYCLFQKNLTNNLFIKDCSIKSYKAYSLPKNF